MLWFLGNAAEELTGARDKFGYISGLKVNWRKTDRFPLATAQEPVTDLGELQWEPPCFQYLGVRIFHDVPDLLDENLGMAIRVLRASTEFWKTLPLLVAGRIAPLKIVAFPASCIF